MLRSTNPVLFSVGLEGKEFMSFSRGTVVGSVACLFMCGVPGFGGLLVFLFCYLRGIEFLAEQKQRHHKRKESVRLVCLIININFVYHR